MARLNKVWLTLAAHSGRLDPWPLLESLGGPEAVARATPRQLTHAGVPPVIAARLDRYESVEVDHHVLVAGTPDYPEPLRGVPFAPPVLFLEGDPEVLRQPLVAVVGTRRCTAYGRRVASKVARAVTSGGGVVVSGLAIGIDTAAHRAAMESGTTVAVLGHGLERGWRRGALRERRRILERGGACVTEFPPWFPPSKYSYPQRNRVIAGLGRVTVVVEAPVRSGALSTARHAVAAGREVLAVPGPIEEGVSDGCLALIERGAVPVRSPATVVEAARLLSSPPAASEPPAGAPRSPGARALQQGPLRDALLLGGTVDQLASRCDLTVVEAIRVLGELEVAGIVRREPGQRYRLAVGEGG